MNRLFCLLIIYSLTSCVYKNPTVTSFYNPEFIEYRADHSPQTQQEAIDSLIRVIHRLRDDEVILTDHKLLTTDSGLEVQVYRLYSDWYGDHLTSFIMQDDGYYNFTLKARTSEERLGQEQEFYSEIIKFNPKNKKSEQSTVANPRRRLFS